MNHTYQGIIGVENLLEAWREFLKGKRAKDDVREFSLRLMDNIFALHNDLGNYTYRHGGYQHFCISDPKPRDIHKANVRDRLLHHAIYRKLYPFFDNLFIADSFSCRKEKGTHKALSRFRKFAYKVSQNNTKTCWVLKCDVRKFFASIDHKILMAILKNRITDQDTVWLLNQVVDSFHAKTNKGLPLGNLTSQLLVNVYMSPFDHFVKHELKAKYYIRYADDFVIFSPRRIELESLIVLIQWFLEDRLGLELHENKIFIKTLASGVDFLGWMHFPDHRVLRTTTKRRMLKRIVENSVPKTISSYLEVLKHGNTYNLKQKVVNF